MKKSADKFFRQKKTNLSFLFVEFGLWTNQDTLFLLPLINFNFIQTVDQEEECYIRHENFDFDR
jgi:hypothetical protein